MCTFPRGTRFDGSLFNDTLSPNPSLANAKQTLELLLFWTKDMWGNWCSTEPRRSQGTATP